MSSSNVRDSSNGRKRFMFIRTYHSVAQIKKVLKEVKNVQHWAYCTHDACGVEPHTHVLVALKDAVTTDNVKRWFSSYKDDKGVDINIHVVGCNKTHAEHSYAYLTHDTPECKAAGKHVYPEEARHTDDFKYWSTFEEGGSEDTLLEAVEKLLDGVPLRELVREYGRDFILHYNAIRTLVADIKGEENYNAWKERCDFADAMNKACKLEE